MRRRQTRILPPACSLLLLSVVCSTLLPRPAIAILCERYDPCVYIDPERFIFVGTATRITTEQRPGLHEPDEVAYFQIDEKLSGKVPDRPRLAFLNTGFEVGAQYLVIGTAYGDELYLDWHGEGYRGFQTALVCGPFFKIADAHTNE